MQYAYEIIAGPISYGVWIFRKIRQKIFQIYDHVSHYINKGISSFVDEV